MQINWIILLRSDHLYQILCFINQLLSKSLQILFLWARFRQPQELVILFYLTLATLGLAVRRHFLEFVPSLYCIWLGFKLFQVFKQVIILRILNPFYFLLIVTSFWYSALIALVLSLTALYQLFLPLKHILGLSIILLDFSIENLDLFKNIRINFFN